MFRAVRELPRLDRLVFRYYYWEGYEIREIVSVLQTDYRLRVSRGDVVGRLAALERRLSNDHRWRLVSGLLRSAAPISLDEPRRLVREDVPVEVPDHSGNAEARVDSARARAVLRELVVALPEREQLALRLRFERGLTAKAVAKALGIQNYKRVYEIQARALSRLADELRDRGIELTHFSHEDFPAELLP